MFSSRISNTNIAAIIVLALAILIPTVSGSAAGPDLWLSVNLKDRYNPESRVCTAIGFDLPLEIMWKSGPVSTQISARLGKPTRDVYPLTFSIEERTSEGPQYSLTEVLRLTVGKPTEEDTIASSLFNDIHHQNVLLTNAGCR